MKGRSRLVERGERARAQLAFGWKLRTWRKDRELTVEEVSEALGVTPTTLRRVEVGGCCLPWVRVLRLKRLMGEELLGELALLRSMMVGYAEVSVAGKSEEDVKKLMLSD